MRGGIEGGVAPEIVAARRRQTRRTLRLYGIGVAAVALLILLIFFIYNFFAAVALGTNAHIARADTAFARGRYAVAEGELRAAAGINSGDYTILLDLGIVLLREGRYNAALTTLRQAEDARRIPTAYLYAAVAGLAMHRPDLAHGDAQIGLALAPRDAELSAALAYGDQGLGDTARGARELAAARSDGYTGHGVRDWIANATLEGV